MADVVTLKNPGAEPGKTSIDTEAFGAKVKKRLLREAVLMYAANKRQGTHSTKTRAEVKHSQRKPYKQKGTGRARAGDFASPLWRKGGIVFGPKPRDYHYDLPKRAKREALRTAILGKITDGEAFVLEAFAPDKPSTKQASAALKKLSVQGTALVLTPGVNDVVYRSFRNIAGVTVRPASDANAYEVLRHRSLVFIGDALGQLKERLPHA